MNAFFKKSLPIIAVICLSDALPAQQLSFDSFSHTGGSHLQSGSSYRFHNVTTGVDAVIKVESLSNASLLQIDDSPITSSRNDNAAWRPIISGVSSSGRNELHYVDFSVRFLANGTNSPVALDDITMSIFDTDGDNDRADFSDGEDGDVREFAQVAGFSSLISTGNKLDVVDYANGSKLVIAKDSTTNPGVTDAAPWLSVWNFENNNSFSVRLGWQGTDNRAGIDNDRLYGAYFNGKTKPEIIPEPSSALMALLSIFPLIMRRKR